MCFLRSELQQPDAKVAPYFMYMCVCCSPRTQAPLFKFAFARTHHTSAQHAYDARERASVRIKQMRKARAFQLLLHGLRVFVSQPVTSGPPSHGAYQHFELHRYARHAEYWCCNCILAGDKVSHFTTQWVTAAAKLVLSHFEVTMKENTHHLHRGGILIAKYTAVEIYKPLSN
jgi:hypothetical protein